MSWDLAEVNARLETVMQRAFRKVLEIHQERKIDLRTAANTVAIARVVEASRLRGLYP
jgi:glutamate dehydrogenase (NAD(P)+)